MSAAKRAYRGLLRAARDLVGEDKKALLRSKQEIRSHFELSRTVKDQAQLAKLIQDANEAEQFIRLNVVQARRTDHGTYAVELKDPAAMDKAAGESTHIDFEPIPPQVAIEKALHGPKKPSVQVAKKHKE